MSYVNGSDKAANGIASSIGGYFNPWVAAAKLIVGGASRPLEGSDSGAAQGVSGMNEANAGQGMQMQAAPNAPQAERNMIDETGDSLFPGGSRLMNQNTAPAPSVAGGFSVQPSQVNSDQPGYKTGGMQDYLNYMKYRGGY